MGHGQECLTHQDAQGLDYLMVAWSKGRSAQARIYRWNSLERMTLRNYLRQVSYAVKVMAAMDLKAKNPLAAP